MRRLYTVKFGKKLEWMMCVYAESRKEAKAKIKEFKRKYNIKGWRIKIW
jgi:hypothetical protein